MAAEQTLDGTVALDLQVARLVRGALNELPRWPVPSCMSMWLLDVLLWRVGLQRPVECCTVKKISPTKKPRLPMHRHLAFAVLGDSTVAWESSFYYLPVFDLLEPSTEKAFMLANEEPAS